MDFCLKYCGLAKESIDLSLYRPEHADSFRIFVKHILESNFKKLPQCFIT